MMNGYRESDSLILSEKSPNKIGDNKPIAEEVEKRRLAERICLSETGARHCTGYFCQLNWRGYGIR